MYLQRRVLTRGTSVEEQWDDRSGGMGKHRECYFTSRKRESTITETSRMVPSLASFKGKGHPIGSGGTGINVERVEDDRG